MMRFLYSLYERRLTKQVEGGPTPQHVGIILDGNRRFGRADGLAQLDQVYDRGAEKLDEVLDWCSDLGISAITLWVCSTKNLSRAPDEVSGILTAIEKKLRALIHQPQIHGRQVRVRAAGRLEMLPDSLVEAVQAVEAATDVYDSMTLTIAVAYGGREEITDAVRALLRDKAITSGGLGDLVDEITPELIGQYMYVPDLPDPDLIIRTSGEIRLSGFLLWQSSHSEFYFSDVYWPAFRKIDFLRAIRSYQQRQRRYGM
jgi:short-chain Z-isoprenyl diphosphate synthase